MPRAVAVLRTDSPGFNHDLTQVRQAGLVELALILGVTLLADAGYQGLSTQTAGAVITPAGPAEEPAAGLSRGCHGA